MTQKLIGLVGFIGSGKGTVGDYLVSNHNFISVSFAQSLKDAVSAIFRWDRELLEGRTSESRIWREQPDQYWSKKFGKIITPRWVLQQIGTDILRNQFLDDIWIASLEKHLDGKSGNYVITDVRFENEIKLISNLGGEIWWVRRGNLPNWYNLASTDKKQMKINYPDIHSSEYDWIGQQKFIELYNDQDLQYLYNQADKCLKI